MIEEKVLENFKRKMKEKVKDLDLIAVFNEDAWPDEDGNYFIEVLERKDNGRVWTLECTRSGNIKEVYEL